MTSFPYKPKLQQHQETHAKNELPLNAQRIRPSFPPKESIGYNFSRPAGSLSPLRPRSNRSGSPKKFPFKKDNKTNQGATRISDKSSLEDYTITVRPDQLSSDHISKTTMRRRSCCCEWCGGVSKLENKHSDIDLTKEENVVKSMTKVEMKAKTQESEGSRPILNKSSSKRATLKVQSPALKKHESTSISSTKANRITFETPEDININEYFSVSSLEPDETQRVRNNRDPKFVVRNETKEKEQMPMRNFTEREHSILQQYEQMQPAVWPKVKKVIKPVKLRRDFGLSSIRKKRHELEKMLSTDELQLIGSQSVNLMGSPKATTQFNGFPKLINKAAGLNSLKVEKISKAVSPLASPSVENSKRPGKNIKLEALNSFDDRSDLKSKTNSKFRGFFKPKTNPSNQRVKTESDEPEESVESECLSATKQERQNESPGKFKARRGNSQKTLIAFGATKDKIMKAYVEEKESISPTKRATIEPRAENILDRVVFDTHNILFMSSPQSDSIPFSFTENYSAYKARREEKQKDEVKSAEMRRTKRRDTTKLKNREGQTQWLVHSFSMNKSSSMTIFPPLGPLQNKMAKRKEGVE